MFLVVQGESEEEKVIKRERERGMKEQEERGKGRESSVACRLEIIGVRISGQSVIFIVDAVV